MTLQRIVAVLLDRGALEQRGAKAELARLLGVAPEAVYQAVYRAQRRAWISEVER